jgi:hypothetical protein
MSSVHADIPEALKPQQEPEAFITLSRAQAEEAQMCFARETLYKKEIGNDSSPWTYFIIGAFAGIAVGAIVTLNH